jgi:hypothetical protein
MAGPVQRGSRGRGRSSRDGSSSQPRVAGSGVASGSTAPASSTLPTAPDPGRLLADTMATRSTYRVLLMRGLSPEEAANLTAFLCGIPIDQVRWSLRQVNQLLFLRAMARTGRFGAMDGESPRPH